MQIIQLSTLMELFNRPEKTMFRIFLLLAVLCILISSFGVFFLVSLSTEQRKRNSHPKGKRSTIFRYPILISERIFMADTGQ